MHLLIFVNLYTIQWAISLFVHSALIMLTNTTFDFKNVLVNTVFPLHDNQRNKSSHTFTAHNDCHRENI